MISKNIWEDQSVAVEVRLQLAIDHIRLLEGKINSYENVIRCKQETKGLLNEDKPKWTTSWVCPIE